MGTTAILRKDADPFDALSEARSGRQGEKLSRSRGMAIMREVSPRRGKKRKARYHAIC